ncbi:IS3 family transposase [Rossellomorea aquimaris]|uniref:IS3 family transposase n=1 Tax=Rossellomorea aquimaris TaxID=189382 RepID=UPI001CD5D780|nr:IS3 family transposase [Rossellomorea aquimaris]MCA1054922.1 IS3 family transposase [Rossellomorea aquimaris]
MSLNRNAVQRFMQKHHLQCSVRQKRKSQGKSVNVAPNLLKRDFTASQPNQKWVTDITYIQYGPDILYLSTILDLFNNEIVAYKLYTHQQIPLVINTLSEALEKRRNPKGVIIHSDQGSAYASYEYQNQIKENHLVSSMSRRGNYWDTTVIESYHSNLKSEEVREREEHFMRYFNEERI